MSNDEHNLDKFCLNWDDYPYSVTSVIYQIHLEGQLQDVTLVCEDKAIVGAHRLILSASSKFFREILSSLPSHNPCIYLKGTTHKQINQAIELMYSGKLVINEEDLSSFLSIARDLDIEGVNPPSHTEQNSLLKEIVQFNLEEVNKTANNI